MKEGGAGKEKRKGGNERKGKEKRKRENKGKKGQGRERGKEEAGRRFLPRFIGIPTVKPRKNAVFLGKGKTVISFDT